MFRVLLALALTLPLALPRQSLAGPSEDNTTAAEADPQTSTDQGKEREADAPDAPTPRRRLLPTTLAVVPGFVVHGLGHWVAGDRKTAFRLLRYEILGLGMVTAAGLALQMSGGTRYGNEVTIPLLVAGTGLFFNSFIADVYGSASRGTGYHYARPSDLSATIGYAYIYDPLFAYQHFSVLTAHARLGDVLLTPALWTALDANNQRARAGLAYEFLGNAAGEYLRIHGAYTYHHFGDDGFSNHVGELSLQARIEMKRLGESLSGSYASASYGLGAERTSYAISSIEADTYALLLGHFGYGFYLPKSGQLEAYYEHRRDTFTAGLSPGTRNGSGFLGHFGLRLEQPIYSRFTVEAQAEIGSALLLTLGLRINVEKRP